MTCSVTTAQLAITFDNGHMCRRAVKILRDILRMKANLLILSHKKTLHYQPFIKYNFKYGAVLPEE